MYGYFQYFRYIQYYLQRKRLVTIGSLYFGKVTDTDACSICQLFLRKTSEFSVFADCLTYVLILLRMLLTHFSISYIYHYNSNR